MGRNRNAPIRDNDRGAKQTNFNDSIPPLEKLKSRLENVQQRGHGYRADCPNEHRSKLQLSFKLTADGMLLLKCHSGCSALEVLQPIGLKLSDLYEKPVTRDMTPQQKRELRVKVRMQQWKAVRSDLIIEMNVLLLASGQVYRGFNLSEEDMERMLRAGRILRSALEYL